ncbi:uncharacterized protein LOC115620653 isoform X2 [Scaptodrosophila lebanonensis]|uniref:Uncharacterized protein LOC115620653 isoform X2 n=1 Tax=Drosophila lebanonensis TaxID=7225 RepID=A0A6J2T3P0_DROLE|nr:uncharacterized protein LOC115620653 isoform X2 [Scaptodrosophila lebanonensis]
MQGFKVLAILAIVLVAHQANAGTISIGGVMSDVSQVAVAGEKIIHQLENTVQAAQPEPQTVVHHHVHIEKLHRRTKPEPYFVDPETQNILSAMANALGDLANAITHIKLNEEDEYVKPQPRFVAQEDEFVKPEPISDKYEKPLPVAEDKYVKPQPRFVPEENDYVKPQPRFEFVKPVPVEDKYQKPEPWFNPVEENDYVKPEAQNLIGAVLGGVANGLGDLANTITGVRAEEENEYVKPQPRFVPEENDYVKPQPRFEFVKPVPVEDKYQKPEPWFNPVEENDYVKPEAQNLIGAVLGGVANGLGDLANTITGVRAEEENEYVKPQPRFVPEENDYVKPQPRFEFVKPVPVEDKYQKPEPWFNPVEENDYVKPEAQNLIGAVLGGVANGLGDLANTITGVRAEEENEYVKPQPRFVPEENDYVKPQPRFEFVKPVPVEDKYQKPEPWFNPVEENDYVKPEAQNLIGAVLGGVANGLGDLANTITGVRAEEENEYVKPQPRFVPEENDYVKPQPRFEFVKPVPVEDKYEKPVPVAEDEYVKPQPRFVAEPEAQSVASDGASIIGEGGAISAKTIAKAANVAAPYVDKINEALGDLANTITGL